MPKNVNKEIQAFVNQVKEILGKRLKKLFYMVLMLEAIITNNQMLIL